MPIQHEVAGPVKVVFNSIDLGYTRDGVQVSIEPKWIEIPSDDWGGQAGAPSDIQLVGAIATITLELTKYVKAEVEKLTSFTSGGTAFTLPTFGTLMKQGSKTAALLLDGANDNLTFPVAFPKRAHEFNKGTKFTTYMLGFEAHLDAAATRVLCNIT